MIKLGLTASPRNTYHSDTSLYKCKVFVQHGEKEAKSDNGMYSIKIPFRLTGIKLRGASTFCTRIDCSLIPQENVSSYEKTSCSFNYYMGSSVGPVFHLDTILLC